MIIWVHCNKCYTRFVAQEKFFITNCYHVFCEKCLDKLQQADTCLVCNSSKPGVVQLTNDMPESVKMLFTSCESAMNRTESIVKFQMDNCLNLLKQTIAKYNQLKVVHVKMSHTLNAQKNEIRNLKEALLMRSNYSGNTYETSSPAMMRQNMSTSSSHQNNVSFSTIQNPYSGHRYPYQDTRMPPQNYNYPGQAQRIQHEGRQVPMRPSPVQIVPTHLGSGGSGVSSATSKRNLSLMYSAQRRTAVYKMGHQKF